MYVSKERKVAYGVNHIIKVFPLPFSLTSRPIHGIEWSFNEEYFKVLT